MLQTSLKGRVLSCFTLAGHWGERGARWEGSKQVSGTVNTSALYRLINTLDVLTINVQGIITAYLYIKEAQYCIEELLIIKGRQR